MLFSVVMVLLKGLAVCFVMSCNMYSLYPLLPSNLMYKKL
jgi:hypothetical protein